MSIQKRISVASAMMYASSRLADQFSASIAFGLGVSFDVRLRQLQAVPAPFSNALSNGPCDVLSLSGRELVEESPGACDLPSALQVSV
jgi:hypothetical protein